MTPIRDDLKMRCEEVGVDFCDLECDLEDFLDNLNMGIKSSDWPSHWHGDGVRIGRYCGVSCQGGKRIEEICEIWNARHPNKSFIRTILFP